MSCSNARAWLFRKNFYEKLSEPKQFGMVVIGGLICSTMLTFMVLPVLYEIVETRLAHRGAALT